MYGALAPPLDNGGEGGDRSRCPASPTGSNGPRRRATQHAGRVGNMFDGPYRDGFQANYRWCHAEALGPDAAQTMVVAATTGAGNDGA